MKSGRISAGGIKTGRVSADEEHGLKKQPGSPSTPVSKVTTHFLGLPTVLVAGLSYCVASGSMVILNKHALNPKSFGWQCPTALLAFQVRRLSCD